MNVSSSKEITTDTIIVLNYNHLSSDPYDGFKVGAVSFAIEISKILITHNVFLGFLLYKRDDELNTPVIKDTISLNTTCTCVNFNFKMNMPEVISAFRSAFLRMRKRKKTERPTLIYYQTDTLLDFHPKEFLCCLTHHGPFVEDFTKNYSHEEACLAFEREEKLKHLFLQQRRGLDVLKRNDIFVIQHSQIQREFLLNNGVKENLIKAITPPITVTSPRKKNITKSAMRYLGGFIDFDNNEILLFTAVARLDYFKNIEMLIRASIFLLKEDAKIKILIIGDNKNDLERRLLLQKIIPEKFKSKFMFIARLPQDELISLYECVYGKSIFICSSRYETLGITPIEASLNGICTLVPDLLIVEASSYYPEIYRYFYNDKGLYELLKSILKSTAYENNKIKEFISKKISPELIEAGVLSTWKEMSDFYSRQQSSDFNRIFPNDIS